LRIRRFAAFAHQAFRRLCVSAALNENLQDETVLIDSTSQPTLLAAN